jgi:hypothetical protein
VAPGIEPGTSGSVWSGALTTEPQRRSRIFFKNRNKLQLSLVCDIKEEHRLRVFDSRVPRNIFGPKKDEVTGRWRKLHNKELRDLYSLPSIIRIIKFGRMRWAGHVARMRKRGTRIGNW